MLSALGLSPKAPCTEAWPLRLQHHQTENLSSETEAMGWGWGGETTQQVKCCCHLPSGSSSSQDADRSRTMLAPADRLSFQLLPFFSPPPCWNRGRKWSRTIYHCHACWLPLHPREGRRLLSTPFNSLVRDRVCTESEGYQQGQGSYVNIDQLSPLL